MSIIMESGPSSLKCGMGVGDGVGVKVGVAVGSGVKVAVGRGVNVGLGIGVIIGDKVSGVWTLILGGILSM